MSDDDARLSAFAAFSLDNIMKEKYKLALRDIVSGLRDHHIWRTLGWYDVLARYRRSTLGPWWITLSMAITIFSLGPLYASIFGRHIGDYLPHMGMGFILWTFISSSINESCSIFSESAHYLKQTSIPVSVFILRVIFRQFIILSHNIILYPIILYFMWNEMHWKPLVWIIPSFLLVIINLYWICLVLAIFCARFRDMPPVVSSIMTLLFFFTPIIWVMDQTILIRRIVAASNPLYSLLNLLRKPLLGITPTAQDWWVSIIIAMIGIGTAFWLLARTRTRITYWL